MSSVPLLRHDLLLLPESRRVIIRPFIPSPDTRITAIIGRALALTEEEVLEELAALRQTFADRHRDLDGRLLAHFE